MEKVMREAKTAWDRGIVKICNCHLVESGIRSEVNPQVQIRRFLTRKTFALYDNHLVSKCFEINTNALFLKGSFTLSMTGCYRQVVYDRFLTGCWIPVCKVFSKMKSIPLNLRAFWRVVFQCICKLPVAGRYVLCAIACWFVSIRHQLPFWRNKHFHLLI